MNMKFDHLGVVVSDIENGKEHFSNVHGLNKWSKKYYDNINGVIVQFGKKNNGLCYELIAPIDDKSPVYNVIMKKYNILNHVAYLVDDIKVCYEENLKSDFIIISEPSKAIAYNMDKIQFFYSKKYNYILELIQSALHEHVYFKN